MAEKFLDAVKIYNELSAMGHDNTPAKQRRKAQLHGYRVLVYDQNGNPSPVQADQVEKQVSRRNFRKGNMYLTREEVGT